MVIDRRHGIRTSQIVRMNELGLEHPERVSYEPSGWGVLRKALDEAQVDRDDVFLDVGSGMGRVAFQAALRYPFRRVIGVELSGELNEIARRNIEDSRARLRCKDVDLHTADATEWRIPDDVTVVYLYNPVRGHTFSAVLDRLLESLDRAPRRMRLIYRTPEEHEQIMASGRFRVSRRLRGLRPGASWSRSSSTYVYEPAAPAATSPSGPAAAAPARPA